MIIQEVRESNPRYFTENNKRFFGDISYDVITSEVTGRNYLLTFTNKFSDMFDGVKKPVYVITPLIGSSIGDGVMGQDFKTIEDVNLYINN